MRGILGSVLSLMAVLMLLAAVSGVIARLREEKIRQVRPGVTRGDVERLLGAGQPDIMTPACEACPTSRAQFVYRGNPSLWYGRLEDSLVVCYTNGVVCDTTRVGL